LMAMVPSCIGRLSVFSVYFNNGARNNLRSHSVRSSSSELFSSTFDPFVR
jgi:hypothetical protein